jgi:RNA polymerase sigma-70 factor (ECF subfamily)
VKSQVGSELTNAELIASCLEANSEAAWRVFVARFQPLIASVILRTVSRSGRPDRDLVDDLVQETFLRLCRNQGRLLRDFKERHETAIFGFIKVVATSVALDHFRSLNSQKRLGDRQPEPEEAIDAGASSPSNAEQVTMVREINDQIDRLAENSRDKTIFWLYYGHGWTARDIASLPQINLTPKGVESCIFRLTRAVRDCMVRKSVSTHGTAEGESSPSALREMG